MSSTIVLIHGYGFDARSWSPVDIAFDGMQVIKLSLPGFGSEAPTEPYTIASLAQKYWQTIEAAAHPTVHLVGHSMGGYVCMEMAAQQPSGVASLALVHSHVFADSAEKKEHRTATMEAILSEGRKPLVHKMIPSLLGDAEAHDKLSSALITRGMQYEDTAWYYGTQAMRDRSDHSETLKSMKSPVLMIGGKLDKAVPEEMIFKQAHLAANNTLHMYDNTGHLGMYENTAQMIGDLISFYQP